MHPHLFTLPIWIFVAILGGAVGATFGGKSNRAAAIGCAFGALLAGLIASNLAFGKSVIPVQGYGVMILIGFSTAVALAEWRVPKIGVEYFRIFDLALTGAFLGITGARIFYIAMNWGDFNPYGDGAFDASKLVKMVAIWEGGLVFYGAFLVAIPWTYIYCRRHKLPAIPLLDIAAPGLVLGQAFGRIGCFLTGCCFGRTCPLPWAVTFPGRGDSLMGSPPFEAQVKLGELSAMAARSNPVHPTQLYASIAAFLTYAFLVTYWPRRKYDGQILSLTLIMAGTTRFFEEMLRNDDAPPFPAISDAVTVAQWLAVPIVLVGFGLMLYFRSKNAHYTPPVAAQKV